MRLNMHLLPHTLLVSLALYSGVSAVSDDKEKVVAPCTVASNSGSFYDLRPLTAAPPKEGKKPKKSERTEDWKARGYDYRDGNANFTLNICAAAVGAVEDVVGIKESLWKNVSAHYTVGDKTYSIGQQASELTLRGRRLVLQYSGGSPCGGSKKRSFGDDEEQRKHAGEVTASKTHDDDDDEDEDEDEEKGRRQKSTIISFHCDKDPLANQASVSFVGTDPDECSYHFEVLSTAACIGSEPAKQGVGPGAVFAIIGVIAILVYFLGGVFYQRNVSHARGWRQLPNYSMWAGIGNFIQNCIRERWASTYNGSKTFSEIAEKRHVEIILGFYPCFMIAFAYWTV